MTKKKSYITIYGIVNFCILMSCAADQKQYEMNFPTLPNTKGFNNIGIFSFKNETYAINCDYSKNKLFFKLLKDKKNWKRTKYISRGCEKNLEAF